MSTSAARKNPVWNELISPLGWASHSYVLSIVGQKGTTLIFIHVHRLAIGLWNIPCKCIIICNSKYLSVICDKIQCWNRAKTMKSKLHIRQNKKIHLHFYNVSGQIAVEYVWKIEEKNRRENKNMSLTYCRQYIGRHLWRRMNKQPCLTTCTV